MVTKTSPFPGMDPFLEKSSRWKGVQSRLIVVISDLLNAQVPDNFAVQIEGAVKILDAPSFGTDTNVVPDVYVTQQSPLRAAQPASALTISDAVVLTPQIETRVELRWLEVLDLEKMRVVCTIEVLSPYNKTGVGYQEFAEKRATVMQSGASWVEIDLLRRGRRPFFIEEMPDYYALTKQAWSPQQLLWPVSLQDRLPVIGVPLLEGYDLVPLDLQAAVDKTYKTGRFAQIIDYSAEPPPPKVAPDERHWIAHQVATWRTNPEIS